MPASVSIFTACFGGYDTPLPQKEQDIDVDWIFITDDPNAAVPAPWRKVVLPESTVPPRLRAREVRAIPTKFLASDYAVWIDANMEVTNPRFAQEALACLRHGVAVWRHPTRNCIYSEARASVSMQPVKYADQPIAAQVAHYYKLGYPAANGLFACGTMAFDLHDPIAKEVGEHWYDECVRWSIQDQLSLPFVYWQMRTSPGIFPHKQVSRTSLSNPWLIIRPHLAEER